MHPANRLSREKSPYLLQHAHNPVDWYPWGEEAFARARAEDKPVFLSVGYSTCHWCHVMERESFENEAIAKILNERFVAIKVDREERPDVDEIYMEAVQALNHGSGGWPMSVFLTPEGKPFYAGTYFPPEDGRGRPGFGTLLLALSEAWTKDRAGIEKQGQALTDYLSSVGKPDGPTTVDAALLPAAASQILRRFDGTNGGFGSAPKFPPTMMLAFLMREGGDDPKAAEAVRRTLDAMARGGIYDQIGGGFARYSTDERWLVPHFEKMLYDNAQLARNYTESFAATGNRYHARIAREVLDYVLREMTAPEGAFWSATDADSEGEEGKFFVWKPGEVEAVLGKDEGAAFCAYYGVTAEGNFEHGSSVLHVPVWDEAREEALKAARQKLYAARAKRIPPHLDDKILVSWNGLMIGELAYAGSVFDEPRYRDAAVRAARFLLKECRVDGRLRRGWRGGVMSVKGFLDDYAFLAAGLLDVYEATGDLEFWREARALSEEMVRLFEDPVQGAFWSTAGDHEKLIARRKDPYDGAIPSGISVACGVLLRVAAMTGDAAPRAGAEKAIGLFRDRLEQAAPAQPELLRQASFLVRGPREIVISGHPGDPAYERLAATARATWTPHRVLAFANGAPGEEAILPLLEGRSPAGGARAFVCREMTCAAPVTTPEELRALLK